MGIHNEVLIRAKTHAAVVTDRVNESNFFATRYTGNALEKDHLVTEELTEYGLKEMRVILPPLIAVNNILVRLFEDPRSSELLNQTMSPMFEIVTALTGKEPLPHSQAVANIREDNHRWQDLLNLNRENISNPQSVHIINASGIVIE